jgi:hypothetical protein
MKLTPMLIEQLIRIKMAELQDLAAMLASSDGEAPAPKHLCTWIQRLGELALLHDASGRLPEAFVRKSMPSAARRLTYAR